METENMTGALSIQRNTVCDLVSYMWPEGCT
jgi:hypothetical protein